MLSEHKVAQKTLESEQRTTWCRRHNIANTVLSGTKVLSSMICLTSTRSCLMFLAVTFGYAASVSPRLLTAPPPARSSDNEIVILLIIQSQLSQFQNT